MIGQGLRHRGAEQILIGDAEEHAGDVVIFGQRGVERVIGSALRTIQAQVLIGLPLDVDHHQTCSLFDRQRGIVHEGDQRIVGHQIVGAGEAARGDHGISALGSGDIGQAQLELGAVGEAGIAANGDRASFARFLAQGGHDDTCGPDLERSDRRRRGQIERSAFERDRNILAVDEAARERALVRQRDRSRAASEISRAGEG